MCLIPRALKPRAFTQILALPVASCVTTGEGLNPATFHFLPLEWNEYQHAPLGLL